MAHMATSGPIPDNVVVCTNSENIAFIDSGIISDTDTVYSIAHVNCTSSDAAVVLTDNTHREDTGCVTVEQMLSMDLSVDISSSGSTIDIMSTSCGDCDQRECSVVSDDRLVDYCYDQQVTAPGCVPILVELPNGQVIQVMGEAAPSDTTALQDIQVPEVVAAETVVTTALPRRRKQAFPTVVRSGLGSPRVELVSPSSASDGSAGLWSPSMLQVDGSVLSTTTCFEEASEAELSTSQESFVALMPHSASGVLVTDSGIIMSMSTQDASIREITKRERDRLKKRELRQNPAFKEREKIKARSRMRSRRCDPEYREVERQKDRCRRRASRQRNMRQRQLERERDKSYKRQRRNDTVSVTLVEAEGKDESYVFDIGDTESIGLDE